MLLPDTEVDRAAAAWPEVLRTRGLSAEAKLAWLWLARQPGPIVIEAAELGGALGSRATQAERNGRNLLARLAEAGWCRVLRSGSTLSVVLTRGSPPVQLARPDPQMWLDFERADRGERAPAGATLKAAECERAAEAATLSASVEPAAEPAATLSAERAATFDPTSVRAADSAATFGGVGAATFVSTEPDQAATSAGGLAEAFRRLRVDTERTSAPAHKRSAFSPPRRSSETFGKKNFNQDLGSSEKKGTRESADSCLARSGPENGPEPRPIAAGLAAVLARLADDGRYAESRRERIERVAAWIAQRVACPKLRASPRLIVAEALVDGRIEERELLRVFAGLDSARCPRSAWFVICCKRRFAELGIPWSR